MRAWLRERSAARRRRARGPGDPATAQADDLEERLVWILGSPRTGSTWLLRLLIHPFALGRDPVGFRQPVGSRPAPGARAVVPIDEPYLPVHLTPVLVPPYARGEQIEPSAFLHNTQRASDPSYFLSDEYADVWRPAVRALVLTRFGAQVDRACDRYGLSDPLIAIKEPNGSHGAELLMSLFPRSRLIFLMRDGRDVVESKVDAHLPGGWLKDSGVSHKLDDPARRGTYVLNQSRLWVQQTAAVSNAYERHPEALRLQLRYEDLLKRPKAEVRRVLDWLGDERADETIARALAATAGDRRAAQPGLWRETLSEAEQRWMAEVMGPTLAALGYE